MMEGPAAPTQLAAHTAPSSKGPLMTRSPLIGGIGGLVLAGLVLVGCASSPGGPGSQEPDSQQTLTPDPDLGAAWLDDGRMIGLVTLGSSTCVPIADSAELDGDILRVELTESELDEPCTADLVPRVTLVGVPEDVDPEQNLVIEVTGEDYLGQVELAGVPGLSPGGETDYEPSAGWAGVEGQFVILTWGSSSCVPVFQDVAATAPAEVTVTYETPADDQVCTMDMAPRGQVAFVSELEEDSDVELMLTGGEFDNVRIPIYGTND
jgi:hypothetical protein